VGGLSGEEDEEGRTERRKREPQSEAGRQAAVVWWEGARGGQMSPLPTTHHHRNRRQPTQLSSPTTTHPSNHPSTHQHIHPSNTPPPSLTLDAFRWSFSASSFGVLSFLLLWGLVLKKHSRQRGLDPRLGKVWGMASGRQLLEAQAGQAGGGGDPPPHPRHRPRRAHSLPRLVFHILPLTTAGPAGG